MALQFNNRNKPQVLVQWDKGEKTKILPEISVKLKSEQNKPSWQIDSICKKKMKKSDFNNKVISLPSIGRIKKSLENNFPEDSDSQN